MNKLSKIFVIGAALAFMAGCTRIETGEVGVRIAFDKEIETQERLPGTLNQTIVGDILTFQTKDVSAEIANITPLASDNSTVADFDAAVIYSLNPQSIAELYIEKNRSFHAQSRDGDTLLMYNYIVQLARNAAYKEVRKYPSLQLADNRANLEQSMLTTIREALAAEGLSEAVSVEQVLVRNILPAKNIIDSANLLVQSENELKRKAVEVETARKEAERIAVLNANAGAVDYMQATAMVTIAEAVKEGRVHTVILPYNFDGIVNVGNGTPQAPRVAQAPAPAR